MNFIEKVCHEIIPADNDITFGRFTANPDLLLLLYGLEIHNRVDEIRWDIIARKILGAVILFNWADDTSTTKSREIIEYFDSHYSFPAIIAANVSYSPMMKHTEILTCDLSLSASKGFVFYRADDPMSIKNVMTVLINNIIHLHS
jgi:signal recognition particle receptor subunit beta